MKPSPPSPYRSELAEGSIVQYYRTHEEALEAAAYSTGFLPEEQPEGEFTVVWRLA